MRNAYSSPSHHPLSPHRLAGVPLIYSPRSRTPFLLRLQACCWRALFAGFLRLRLKSSSAPRQRSWSNGLLS